jgi:hypothetical protein
MNPISCSFPAEKTARDLNGLLVGCVNLGALTFGRIKQPGGMHDTSKHEQRISCLKKSGVTCGAAMIELFY